MTGKDYLIDFMQTHNCEEIYNKIKEIENATLSYTDSRLAFISFLNSEYVGVYGMWRITQNQDGKWVAHIGGDTSADSN